jgi:hypothetical protein
MISQRLGQVLGKFCFSTRITNFPSPLPSMLTTSSKFRIFYRTYALIHGHDQHCISCLTHIKSCLEQQNYVSFEKVSLTEVADLQHPMSLLIRIT